MFHAFSERFEVGCFKTRISVEFNKDCEKNILDRGILTYKTANPRSELSIPLRLPMLSHSRKNSTGRFFSEYFKLNPMTGKHFGVARILNKRGFCSRKEAESLVRSGRVSLEGKLVFNPEAPAQMSSAISVDGQLVLPSEALYFVMNKPRGIVTTAADEKGRKTVMDLLRGKISRHVFPVGRLDKASEGLLLFTNDTAFSDCVLSPGSHLEKEYHVQVSRLPSSEELLKMRRGVRVAPRVFGKPPEEMRMANVRVLRKGEKNAWLSVVLCEGKNREIRRILEYFGIETLRLVRVRIGPWKLGDLGPGEIRQVFPQLSENKKGRC